MHAPTEATFATRAESLVHCDTIESESAPGFLQNQALARSQARPVVRITHCRARSCKQVQATNVAVRRDANGLSAAYARITYAVPAVAVSRHPSQRGAPPHLSGLRYVAGVSGDSRSLSPWKARRQCPPANHSTCRAAQMRAGGSLPDRWQPPPYVRRALRGSRATSVGHQSPQSSSHGSRGKLTPLQSAAQRPHRCSSPASSGAHPLAAACC
mmetsp:Transcript_50095/g.154960  ORF Transcript_50095/g.154960 Transcript_50095/m.154960 type:complete len:213 (-) Transcript_50095:67-705(-)